MDGPTSGRVAVGARRHERGGQRPPMERGQQRLMGFRAGGENEAGLKHKPRPYTLGRMTGIKRGWMGERAGGRGWAKWGAGTSAGWLAGWQAEWLGWRVAGGFAAGRAGKGEAYCARSAEGKERCAARAWVVTCGVWAPLANPVRLCEKRRRKGVSG